MKDSCKAGERPRISWYGSASEGVERYVTVLLPQTSVEVSSERQWRVTVRLPTCEREKAAGVGCIREDQSPYSEQRTTQSLLNRLTARRVYETQFARGCHPRSSGSRKPRKIQGTDKTPWRSDVRNVETAPRGPASAEFIGDHTRAHQPATINSSGTVLAASSAAMHTDRSPAPIPFALEKRGQPGRSGVSIPPISSVLFG